MAKTTWAVDPTHSEINFKVKHMMFTHVSGGFKEFEATAETEDELFDTVAFNFNAKTASVNTGNSERDGHLKSGDFFDAENHPEISFKSTSYEKSDNGEFTLKGDLTLRGVTKPVTLEGEFHGTAVDPWGNKRAGFGISGKINRKDWGLNWNSALETGGVLVGEDVKLIIELQFTKQ